MRPKSVFFFKKEKFLRYRARTDIVDIDADIGSKWPGFTDAGFDTGFDAVLNAGNGFIYFFKGENYIRFDPRLNRVDVPKTLISVGWPKLAEFGFDRDLNAALYYRDGKALFFKENRYLRYNISDNSVDPGYPKEISVGWSNISSTPFVNGIDAAVNYGNGKAYFFKDDKYIRINIATNAVDAGYPLDTAPQWPALVPSGFTNDLSDIVEWLYCEISHFNVQVDPSCKEIFPDQITIPPRPNKVQQLFAMVATLSAPAHPADCRCGEYRQFVRGSHIINGQLQDITLCNPVCNLKILPRPEPGASGENFLEDSLQVPESTRNLHYGHREEFPGNADLSDRYLPNRENGCEYRGFDAPFIEGFPGDSYTLDLDFRGVIIDVCNDNEEIARKEWNVFCKGTFSQAPPP